MSLARRYALPGTTALLLLQPLWHGLLLPPASGGGWLLATLFALPLLPVAVLALRRHPRAAFSAAVTALLYFSHGVMEAWADPRARPLALLESGLALSLVVAASWDGLRARFARKS